MRASPRVSLADLADVTGIAPDLLAAEIAAVQARVVTVRPDRRNERDGRRTQRTLSTHWSILVRYSGTEPKLRVAVDVEVEDDAAIAAYTAEILEAARNDEARMS